MSKQDAPRTAAQIKADLAADRAKLVSSVQGLVDDVNPVNVAKRAVSDAKTFVTTEFEEIKGQVKDETGWRLDRIVPVVGAVAGAVAFVLTLRAIVRGSRSRSLAKLERKQLTNK